jgi:hypothetical protein
MAMAAGGGFEVDADAITGLSQTWASGGSGIRAISQTISSAITKVVDSSDGPGRVTAQLAARDAIEALAGAEKAAIALADALGQDAQGLALCAQNYRDAESRVKQHIDDTAPSSGRGGGHGSGGPPTRSADPSGPANTAQVRAWVDQAFAILEQSGVPSGELDEAGVLLIVEHESSGDPSAENDWDSNWQAGHASKGLMQCIDTTFDAYKLPGHDDIFNPVDNIIAGVRYALSRYGSISNVPGVRSVADGGSYVGY